MTCLEVLPNLDYIEVSRFVWRPLSMPVIYMAPNINLSLITNGDMRHQASFGSQP